MRRALIQIILPLVCLGLLPFPAAIGAQSPQKEAELEWRQRVYQRLQDNLALPLEARVQQMPEELLKATQEDDRAAGIANTDRYAPRAPTAEEQALFNAYLKLLPDVHRKVFSKKLLAIFIVDGFGGAALTNWTVGPGGRSYYYIVLNSALFTASLDDWLTYRANSAFDHPDAPPAIRVRTHTAYKALLYALLHEGTHVVDYEFGITPCVDPQYCEFSGRLRETSEFTGGVWAHFAQPVPQYDFTHRAGINAYGLNARKGLIPRTELREMFTRLGNTPFVSFYASTSWSEDLADYVSYHHLERRLGGSVSVELLDQGHVIARRAPGKTALARQREKSVRAFEDWLVGGRGLCALPPANNF